MLHEYQNIGKIESPFDSLDSNGGLNMKICVIYDTKRRNGATVHIAKWIQEALTDAKIAVELKSGDKVDNFDYDLFIVGSPIYWERPMKSMVNFLSENREKLKDKRVAIES